MFTQFANLDDIHEIEKCGKISLPIYYTSELLKALFSELNIIILKNVIKNKFTGFLIARVHMDHIHILSIAVFPEYRKQGIATNLINAIKSMYKIKMIILQVQVSNIHALKLYIKLNFILNKYMKYYYSDLDCNDAYEMIYHNKID